MLYCSSTTAVACSPIDRSGLGFVRPPTDDEQQAGQKLFYHEHWYEFRIPNHNPKDCLHCLFQYRHVSIPVRCLLAYGGSVLFVNPLWLLFIEKSERI